MAPIEERAAGATLPAASPWKERLDDPFNRFYRYPVARVLVKVLVPTPITPAQVSFVQPFLAGLAGYFVMFPDRWHLFWGALFFEIRSVLDCVDGTLARARGQASTRRHAVVDGLSAMLLCVGIFWHFRLFPPHPGTWSRYLSAEGVVFLALVQGALRALAADHYNRKYGSIFEQDGTAEELSRKARLVALFWSVSSGGTFLSLVVFSLLVGRLWEGQLFLALAGLPWTVLAIALHARFGRGSAPVPARGRAPAP